MSTYPPVAGYSYTANDSIGSAIHAFLWTEVGGMQDLGFIGGFTGTRSNSSYGCGISANGSVVGGSSQTATDSTTYPFIWTPAGGMVNLGNPDPSIANGTGQPTVNLLSQLSADGSTLCGYVFSNSLVVAWIWKGGNFTILPSLPGANQTQAQSISADGSTVVGFSGESDSTLHAFLWTSSGGIVDLGILPGLTGNQANSRAYGSSNNGTVVVGQSPFVGGGSPHAFVWTLSGGIKDLNSVLSSSGVDMTGITLVSALGVSPNGRYVVGNGIFSYSYNQAFLVDLQAMALYQIPDFTSSGTGGVSNAANAVNDAGVVTGFAQIQTPLDQYEAFIYTVAGGLVNLGTLGPDRFNHYSSQGNAIGVSPIVTTGGPIMIGPGEGMLGTNIGPIMV
jgi:probable HAF family extracellular repeat protein